MEGGKSTIAVIFASAAEADRRVAGVAAAARIARDAARSGSRRVLLAVPGRTLRPATRADLERVVEGAEVEIVETAPAGVEAVPAPRLSAAALLGATGKRSDGPVSLWLNRPVSRRISALLLRLPAARPIHATIGTAAIAAAMFGALSLGGPAGLIAGGLLFHAASVFDGVDGEIARATFRTSPAGAALDSAVDAATNLLFVLGVTLNLALAGEPRAALVGGWGLLLFAAGLAAVARGTARGGLNFELAKKRYGGRGGRLIEALVCFATVVTSRDFFALLFALLILAGQPMAVLWIFAGAATLWAPLVAAALAFPPRAASTARSA